ncbi:MAG: FtsB family cell division protein [Candidatus Binataceae bacterium]
MARLSFYLRQRWLSLILGAILAALVANCFVGQPGPRDLLVLRRHRAGLETVRDQLLAQNHQLKTRIAKLRSDNAYLQRLIRRELGYARPNELVYRFADEKSAK